MNLFEVLLEEDDYERSAPSRIYGVVVGLVKNNKDDEGLGRVKVNFPWLNDKDESQWARIATLMTGKGGSFFLPEVEDEVLIAFEQGDVRFPYVIGSLWNGKEKPPADNGDGKNNLRLIKSRSGHTIKLNDEDDKETIEILDKEKKNSVVIDIAKNTITITSEKDITLSASKGTIKLDAKKIELKSSADTKIESGAKMDVTGDGKMTLKGSTVDIN